MTRKKTRQPKIIFIGFCMLLLGGLWLLVAKPANSTFFNTTPTITQQQYSQEANQTLKGNQVLTPLILQTDERWAQDSYGTGEDNTLAKNGCAILSLTMVLSYFEEKEATPQDILSWAQNKYFVNGQGTSWQIFSDFASHYHLQYHDLGNDFQSASKYLQQKIPVIVSVKPGRFTEVGHIMVLGAKKNNQVLVLDPNDTPEKNTYQELFHPEDVTGDIVHYWPFTKS